MNICNNSEKYPSWPKGHPWKGCRSLIAARGFKSLLLRSFPTMVETVKKVVDNNDEMWYLIKAVENNAKNLDN